MQAAIPRKRFRSWGFGASGMVPCDTSEAQYWVSSGGDCGFGWVLAGGCGVWVAGSAAGAGGVAWAAGAAA